MRLTPFVIDPEHRGKGISHEVLKRCGDGRLFAYTRDAVVYNLHC